MDVVLSFSSSIIFRAVYQSRSYSDGVSDEPHPKIPSHLQTQGDAIEQFHTYVRAEKQHTLNITSKARRGTANGDIPICYLVESDGTHAKGLPQGTVLFIFCADGLDLIHCSKDTYGYKMNYMAIRLTHPTRTQCTFSSIRGGQKRLLSLHIHEDDLVTMNDQQRDLKIMNLGIKSEYDLMGILKGFETLGIQCRTKMSRTSSSSRRSSSVVIPLDTDGEMISSSFELSAVASQTRAGRASPSALWRNHLANMLEPGDYVPETVSQSTSQSSLTDLTQTPSLQGTSSPRARDSSRRTSPRSPTKNQWKKERRAVERATSQNKEHLPETGPARNTRSKSSQSRMSVATNNVLRPVPHNTQESLIFPRRRSKGKLYTAPRTKVVDWDEDLRACEGSAEPQSREDAELTSVSSPSSSGVRYTFNQSSKRSRTGSARKKQATNTGRLPKTGSKTKAKKRTKNKVKHLSARRTRPKNGDNQHSPPMDGCGRELDRRSKAGKHEICNKTAKSLAEAKGSSQTREPESISHQAFNSLLLQNTDSANCQSTSESSLKDDQKLGGSTPGRGQTVAEKLIAALRGSSTPEHHLNEIFVKEKLFCDTEHGVEVVPESPEMQNEPDYCKLNAEQEGCKEDKQDTIESWTSVTRQEVISGDELYPVNIYSSESSDEGRDSPLHGNGEHEPILRKRKAMFETANGGKSKRVRGISSSFSSSSVVSLSKESTPGAYYSSSSLKESKSSPFIGQPEELTTAASRFEFHLLEPPPEKRSSTCPGHSDVFALSSSVNQGLFATQSKGATNKNYRLWNPNVGDIGAAQPIASVPGKRIESDMGHVTERLESSAKTIVDKNGSPRLMQRANMAEEEHITLKGQNMSLLTDQQSSKRMSGITQEDKGYITSRTTENQSKDNPEAFQLATLESGTDFSTSRTIPTKKGDHKSFLSCLQASAGERHFSKVLKLASPGSKMREEHQTRESKEYALEPGIESKRKVASELSKGTAGQFDWQASLQELHKGMERTLRNNDEYLTSQIESEQATIDEILNGYREQCHNVLDQLFAAQIERIRLCKQQMDFIKQQHADVCHVLIRRLEEHEQTLRAVWGSQ
ncbi:hypothetical protein BDW75DRAFT_92561 [Aspergillus navahoensis]